jgi:protein gp37
MEVAARCAQLGREDRDAAVWPLPNVWLGVSIENRRFVDRADILRETPAAVRFISAEPLLGPLVPDVATTLGVAFLFKQIGGPTSKSGGRELDGRTWNEFPQVEGARC